MTPHADYTADLIVLALLVAFKLLDALSTARRERKHAENLELRFANLTSTFDKGLARLESFIIGPDGRNGMRGDLASVRERVDGLEERERDTLTAKAQAARLSGTYDRRSST